MKVAIQKNNLMTQPGSPFKTVTNKNEVKDGMTKLAVGDTIYLQSPNQLKPKTKLASMMNQIGLGQKLSGPDMKAEQSISPLERQRALFLKEEREYYKKLLKQCRSKEEVTKLRHQKMNEFLMQIQSVERTPMDAEAKEKAKDFIKQRIEGINEEHEDFVKTTEYGMLPKKVKEDERKRLARQILQDRNAKEPDINESSGKDIAAEAVRDIETRRESGEFELPEPSVEADFETEEVFVENSAPPTPKEPQKPVFNLKV